MSKKNIVSTIEARMTSSRLPGKVLMEAKGVPFLEILVRRLKKAPQIDRIVIATTVNKQDEPIIELAKSLNVGYFRGCEEDVLSRVLSAARKYSADIIVEITGDCPLIDPGIVSSVIDMYLKNKCDYASNVEPATFPNGMDTQVFSVDTLALADAEGKTSEDREHVSWFIRRHPERFKMINLFAPAGQHWPELGLTLDEHSDYILLKDIFEHFYPDMYFSCARILEYLRQNPALLSINKDVKRKELLK